MPALPVNLGVAGETCEERNMKVIAIDPGPEQSAYVVWAATIGGTGHPLTGTIEWAAIQGNMLMRQTLLQMASVDGIQLAIEMVACYGMPVGKEVFETCLWIGRFIESWQECPIPARLVYRKDVKLHHCGNMRAKDANVRMALIDKYGKPGTKKKPGVTYGLKKDLWSAFAIATYINERQKP